MKSAILLEDHSIWDTGTFDLHVDRRIEIQVPAEKARRAVNYFVHMYISTQMHAETPSLVIGAGELVAWRVPVHLTFPSFGDVGCVGYIHVDTATGEVDQSDETMEAIRRDATELALRFTSPTADRS
jgi:hypothetical protein